MLSGKLCIGQGLAPVVINPTFQLLNPTQAYFLFTWGFKGVFLVGGKLMGSSCLWSPLKMTLTSRHQTGNALQGDPHGSSPASCWSEVMTCSPSLPRRLGAAGGLSFRGKRTGFGEHYWSLPPAPLGTKCSLAASFLHHRTHPPATLSGKCRLAPA